MAQAPTLNDEEYQQLKVIAALKSNFSKRDMVIIAATFRGGLRACEVAGMDWRDVTTAFGEMRKKEDEFIVRSGVAKKGSGRGVPFHPDLHDALVEYRKEFSANWAVGATPVVTMCLGEARYSANSLQRYIGRLYKKLGLVGCSSHSGRRSFTTKLARTANTHGCSLRDVQHIVGHRFLDTTEKYIERSEHAGKMVRSL